MAIKYPKGFFQSNGNLYTEKGIQFNGLFFFLNKKSNAIARMLTTLETIRM